jgi:hypothetical protein
MVSAGRTGSMAFILSQFMAEAGARRVVTTFYAVITSGVFAFLALMLLLS